MPVDEVRDCAIDVLLKVFEGGAFIELAIDRKLRRRQLSARGARFMTQLAYGTVRHKLLCDHVLAPVLRHPLETLPPAIRAVLRMGVFQALYCRQVTFPAMVHTSVDLAKKRGHAGTAKLVNAVLKRCPQRIEDVTLPDRDRDWPGYLSVRYSIPLWLIEMWRTQFTPEETEALCDALNQEGPTTIRVNTIKTSADALAARLSTMDCVVERHPAIPDAMTLLSSPPPAKLKLFQEGHFTVQDPASMLVSHAVQPQAGERVLDMCAAPGGKATHVAALADDHAFVFAADIHPRKVGMIRDTVQRLGLESVRVLCADGMHPPFRQRFDRVVLDAPCSGLGTLRKHPDLKWRLKPSDIPGLASRQTALLRNAIDLCENNGVIVYAVCTFTDEESRAVVETVLKDGHATPEDGPDWMDEWKTMTGTYRTLPSLHGVDGFFLTRLRKRS